MNTSIKRRFKNNHLLASSGRFLAGNSISKVLGFLREILFSALLGAGNLYDAFVMANQIPTLFRHLFGEETFENVIGPKFNQLRNERNESTALKYIRVSFFYITLGLAILAVLLYFIIPFILRYIAPGFDASSHLLATGLARWLIVYIVLMAYATYVGAILLFSGSKGNPNSYVKSDNSTEKASRLSKKIDLVYSTAPAVWNISILFFVLIFYQKWGLYSLALGFIAGGLFYLLYQLPTLHQILKEYKRDSPEDVSEASKKTFKDGATIFLRSLANSSVSIVDKIVASLTISGAITSIYLSFRLINLPISLFANSFAKSCTREISKIKREGCDLYSDENKKSVGKLIGYSISGIFYTTTPIVLFFIFLSKPIIYILFKRGEFLYDDVIRVAYALYWYSYAILPLSLVLLFNRTLSVLNKYSVSLKASIAAAVCNIVLDLMLYNTAIGYGGIALATAISFSLYTVILWFSLREFIQIKSLILLLKNILIMIPLASIPLILANLFQPEKTENILIIMIVTAIAGLFSLSIYLLLYLNLVLKPSAKEKDKLKIVLTGGGTGGHVYPALSIRKILQKGDIAIESCKYIGIKGQAEDMIVFKPKLMPSYVVTSAQISGVSLKGKVFGLLKVMIGTLQSARLLISDPPDMVIGTGGYASAPVIFAAYLLRPFLKLKIIVQEQNVTPGLLNKVSSFFADVVLVSQKESIHYLWSDRCIHIGYPLRQEYYQRKSPLQAKSELGFSDKFVVLSVGGSLGSRSINRAICKSILELSKIRDLYFIHAIGMSNSSEYSAYNDTKALINLMASENSLCFCENEDNESFTLSNSSGVFYEGHKYIHTLCDYKGAADIVISRAGAGAIAEITALAKPAILIPKRNLPADHQELNAINVAEKGACDIVFEYFDENEGIDSLDHLDLIERIRRLYKMEEFRIAMSEAAAKIHYADTEKTVISSIYDVIKENENVAYTILTETPKFVRFNQLFDSVIAYIDNLHRLNRSNKQSQVVEELLSREDDYLGYLLFSNRELDFYYRMYSKHIQKYLNSSNFLEKNKAVKLIGALREKEKYGILVTMFSESQGYIRRNILTAFSKADKFESIFTGLIIKALNDSYFEVRREAVRLAGMYISHFSEQERKEIERLTDRLFKRRLEGFEVKSEIIKLYVHIKDEKDFYDLVSPYICDRNNMLKQAVLDAIIIGLNSGKLKDNNLLFNFLDGFVVNNSGYRSDFYVRNKYSKVISLLQEKLR